MRSAHASIRRQVISNIIPAVVVELMILIYNLADTFFIAQTGDPLQIAAVSLAAPVFLVLMALGIIFMVGSSSCISRALGAGQAERASNTASFCIWAGAGTGIITALIFFCFVDQILRTIGASPDTFDFARSYLSIVMTAGAFMVFSMSCSGIMRAENHASVAMTGQVIGNLVNIILDPVMIVWFGWGITGAAIATVIGAVSCAAYYLVWFLSGKSSFSIHIKKFKLNDGIASGVFGVGIPASLEPFLMCASQMVMNSMMSAYGDMAVAAAGVAMRVNQIAGLIPMGSCQGVQPLLGYNVGAKDWDRYRGVLVFSLSFTIISSLVLVLACYVFTGSIVGVFLSETEAYTYAVNFVRILFTTSIASGVFFMFVNALQAMGAGRASLVLGVCRQMAIYVPLMFAFNHYFGAYGLIWALPAAEVLSLLQTICVYGRIIFNPKEAKL